MNLTKISRVLVGASFIIFGALFGSNCIYGGSNIIYPESSATVAEFYSSYAHVDNTLEESTLVADEIIEVAAAEPVKIVESCEMDAELQNWLYDYCISQNTDPYLIMAMCHHESRCRNDAISSCGCIGMMQLSPWYYEDILYSFGLEYPDWYNPQHNIMTGIVVLNNMINTGNGIEWALACYNGGGAYANSGQGLWYAQMVLETAELYRSEAIK